MSNYLRLLRRNPQFTRLFFAFAISLIGDWFNTIVLFALVAAYSSDNAGLAISLLLLARFLPPLVVGPLAGVLTDRFNRQRLLIFADVARAVVVLGFLLVDSSERLWLVYILTVLQFAASALFEPGRSALLPAIVDHDDLTTANILNSAIWSVMLAVGAVLGAAVAGSIGTRGALIIDSMTFLISAALIASIRPSRAPVAAPPEGASNRANFADGLRFARANPAVAATLFVKMGGNVGVVDTIMTIYATLLFVVGENGVVSLGVLWAAFGVGSVIGPLVHNRFNDGSVRVMRRLIISAYAFMVVGWLILAAAPSLAVAALGVAIKAVGSGVYWTYSSVILQRSTPEHLLGRVFALDMMGFQLAVVLSIIVTGAALSAVGDANVRVVVAGTTIATLVPLALWTLTVRWLERREGVVEAPAVPVEA